MTNAWTNAAGKALLPLIAALAMLMLAAAQAAGAEPEARPPTAEEQAAKAEAEARRQKFYAAVAFVHKRELDGALRDLAGLIALFEADPRKPDQLVYCGSNPTETLFYLLKAAVAKQNAVVLESTWADAHYLTGYVLAELNRLAEAQKPLEQAVALSPMNSRYLTELATVLARNGEPERGLSLFKKSEEAAEYGTEESREAYAARARRGQGYALIELGRYDEAEAIYRALLEKTPGDGISRSQLLYIAQKRTESAASSAPSAKPAD